MDIDRSVREIRLRQHPPIRLPNQIEGTDTLGSEHAVEGDRELLHGSDSRVVRGNDGMTCREPFQESEPSAARRSPPVSHSTGVPTPRR